jgi:hypothetical protein
MKIISFSRDSDAEVVINPKVPGTYDVAIKTEDSTEMVSAVSAGEAWMYIRNYEAKVPMKIMLDFAELAIRSMQVVTPSYKLILNPEVTDAE